MAANNSCTQDTTISGTSIFTRGNTGELGNPRGFMNFSNVRYLPSFLAFLLFASFLSSFAIGEIVRDTQNVNSNHVVNNRTEHTLRRMFGNRSEILYKSSNNNGEIKVGAGESRICPKVHGKREIGEERRRRRKERSNDRTRTTGRMNEREDETKAKNSECSSCMRDEMRTISLEAIKGSILSKLGMSQPPNLKGKPMPKIGDHRLAALLSRRHPHNGPNGMFWVLQEDDLDRMQGDSPYGSQYSDKVISKNNDFSNKNSFLRSHGNGSDYRHSDTSHFQEGEMYVDEEDDYHVRTEKIVTFSQPHPRVRHSPYVHYFQFSDKIRSSRVKKAVLWIYIRGRESAKVVGDKITISIYKFLHTGEGGTNSSRESPVITSVLTDLNQNIPKGNGAWITLDYIQIKNLVSEWFAHPAKNLGIIISAEDANKTNLAVTSHGGNGTASVPFLEVYVADNKKHRTKRALGLNCNDSTNETRCCRYPLTVNFEDFGWDWIIAPKTYEANYCSGECQFVFLTRHPHTHVMQLADVPGVGPCCAPRKLSAISMLYFDQNMNIILGTVPDMVVDRCGCA